MPAKKHYAPPSAAELNKQRDKFNADHPVGTPITYTEVKEIPSTARQTKTRSEAWVMGGHSVMVMVQGISGGVRVDHVTQPSPTAPQSPTVTPS